jgi:hypothetical protein
MTRLRARAPKVLAALGASFGATILGACILADPVPDQPAPAGERPAIVGERVSPSIAVPLRELPVEFQVPIELGDPRAAYQWNLFIDFDPVLGGVIGGLENSSNLQLVSFAVENAALKDQCHRIEFIVARIDLGITGRFEGQRGRDPATSDSITWQYAPVNGSPLCSPYDGGGNDGAFPDVVPSIDP